MNIKKFRPFIIAIILTFPGLAIFLGSLEFTPPLTAACCGFAILGASFLLTWACDVAQKDIPQALAIAVVAFIAVLPEYAVDMYFTWMAGQHPQSDYSHFAIANMTGANRLLIGVGWSAIAIIYTIMHKHAVILPADKRTDILFLGMATLYALLIPVKGSLTLVDGAVFLLIYVWYISIIIQRPAAEEEPEGAAAVLAKLPKARRISVIIFLFVFSALVIVCNAEPFSENLVATGKLLGVNEFLLVQWLAPIASEAPEFIIALMFTFHGNATMALGSLISSKLNQWTLLVGMIPAVYAVSSGSVSVPINLDSHQFQEIFLTAAQSLFAVALITNLKLNVREAWILLIIFASQLLSPIYDRWVELALGIHYDPLLLHTVFAWLYIVLAFGVIIWRIKDIARLRQGFKA